MGKPRVLLDCDGVLADFIGQVCRTIIECDGPEYTPDHVTQFDFCTALDLPADLKQRVLKRISGDPRWWSSLSAFPGAIDGVQALRQVADIYIVTSPWSSSKTWLYERETWLKRHFDIRPDRVVATQAKHVVAGDYLVDDKTSTLVEWADHLEGTEVGFPIQWETPHNRRDGWTGRSTRSWAQLVEWCR